MQTDAQRRTEIVSAWLRDYEKLTFAQHQAVYSELWKTNLPEQAYFAADECARMLDWDGAFVAEVGGWDGQLAKKILAAQPGIAVWCNFEVCREAAMVSRLMTGGKSGRFGINDKQWIWEDPHLKFFNTLVASHSLEHMSKAHLELLLSATKHFKQAFIQVPHNMSPGVQSTHILDVTVDALSGMFLRHGWKIEKHIDRAHDAIFKATR